MKAGLGQVNRRASKKTWQARRAAPVGVRLFLCVPSMIDSLEVQVLFTT